MNRLITIFSLVFLLHVSLLQANETESSSSGLEKCHFVGTSFFVLLNLLPDPPVYFGQLDYGYKLTEKDALIIEALGWGFDAPMSKLGSGPKYPGYVAAYGLSFAYQRFHWKKMYTTYHLTPLKADYFDDSDERVTSGFQLWLQFRVGYQFELEMFHQSFYLEPSLESNYWPVNLNVPDKFEEVDDEYSSFLFAPGLNLGIHF